MSNYGFSVPFVSEREKWSNWARASLDNCGVAVMVVLATVVVGFAGVGAFQVLAPVDPTVPPVVVESASQSGTEWVGDHLVVANVYDESGACGASWCITPDTARCLASGGYYGLAADGRDAVYAAPDAVGRCESGFRP